VLELAEAAVRAEVPVWVIGKPYAPNDPYARRFEAVARQHPRWVRYEGPIQDRRRLAEIYSEARGFILLSTMESLSLSALEAQACGCPLLLSDLPWARQTFRTEASYCPIAGLRATSLRVGRFYREAPGLAPKSRPVSWAEVGEQLRGIYAGLLSTAR
jgi:glycosyltransferase involved in cell wall biosynthesis